MTDLRSVLVSPIDTVDMKASEAGLRSGSATSGQSLQLHTERSDVIQTGGGVRCTGAMSLWGGALVLLVYGGFVLQQSQTQVAAPAPLRRFGHGGT